MRNVMRTLCDIMLVCLNYYMNEYLDNYFIDEYLDTYFKNDILQTLFDSHQHLHKRKE